MVRYIPLVIDIMSEFCDMCDNLLDPVFYNDELNFKCVSCNTIYPSDASQSLRFERVKGQAVHDGIMDNAVDDAATLKAIIPCIQSKCKGRIVKQIRIGKSMLLYNICTTCRTSWLYQGK